MSAETRHPPDQARATTATRRRHASVLLTGAVIGLTWSAALRGWMVQLAGAASTLTWLTLVFVLLPGAAVGALLAQAAEAHARGRAPGRVLVWVPALLVAVLLHPPTLLLLLREGYGGGSLLVVITALTAGHALTHRRPSVATLLSALVAASGLIAVAGMATLSAPFGTARGVWVGVLGVTLMIVLCLAAALPHRHLPPVGPAAHVGIGVVCGLAWAGALRVFMAAVVGPDSHVTWVNTIVWILLVGAVVGGLLGDAEWRRTSGRARRVLAVAPLLFAAVLLPGLLHPTTMFSGGIGGGALGVPLLGLAGAYALAGRRPAVRVLTGVVFLVGVIAWLVVADDVGGPGFALDTVRGVWATVLYLGLLLILARATAIPLLPPARPRLGSSPTC